MLSFSAPVAAQSEAQAAIDAAKEIIKSQAPDMVKQVNAIIVMMTSPTM